MAAHLLYLWPIAAEWQQINIHAPPEDMLEQKCFGMINILLNKVADIKKL